MSKLKDLKGMRFGRLVVLERDIKPEYKTTFWRCKCDCNNIVSVRRNALLRGATKSCGCFQVENARKLSTKHSGGKTRLYNIWKSMRKRCNNEKDRAYRYYGGRGIKVCKEWEDFENFRKWAYSNGYTDELTIERKDVNGNYCPENCTWITQAEQTNNRTSTRYLEYNGKRMSMADWSKETGIEEYNIFQRLKLGWSVEKALTTRKNPIGKFLVTYNGKTLNLSQWSKETGIGRSTLEQRLKCGWSIEEAFTIKPSYSNKKLKITKAKKQTTPQETSHED